MIPLIPYTLLSTGILIWVFILYRTFFKKDTYHQWNRHLLLSSVLVSVALPLAFLFLNTFSVFDSLQQINLTEVVIGGVVNMEYQITNPHMFPLLLLLIYAIGFIAGSITFIKQLMSIKHLKDQSQIKEWNGHRVFVHQKNISPFSFLNAIYINEEEFEERNNAILLHESIHIKEKHSYDILILQILQIVFWYNPLYYLYKKELQGLHEYICDAKCITHISENEYRIALLSYRLAESGITINQSFNHFKLKRRLSIMRKQKSGRLVLKAFLMIPILGFGIILMSAMFPNDISISENFSSQSIMQDQNETIVHPTFPGGEAAMMAFLSSNIAYPKQAIEAGISGKVFVQFVVKKNGKVAKVKIKRGLESQDNAARLIETEAIRVVESMPNWTAGMKDGKKVAMEMALPISFKLD